MEINMSGLTLSTFVTRYCTVGVLVGTRRARSGQSIATGTHEAGWTYLTHVRTRVRREPSAVAR